MKKEDNRYAASTRNAAAKKARYETPVIVPLGELARGSGACVPGSGGAPPGDPGNPNCGPGGTPMHNGRPSQCFTGSNPK